ncbi:MAG: hypothetical protein LQ350_006882 [Teloschistes chrysophthalmus]|nr:MAG: hypothetical protein LQ350_006882 [Niorma chrysophthalma]
MDHPLDIACLVETQKHVLDTLSRHPEIDKTILPTPSALRRADKSLLTTLPEQGHGVEKTTSHILDDLTPALTGQALSPRYFGLVTGGVTPAARVAESVVSLYDQNVCVHLPDSSIATTIEDRALTLLLELLDLSPREWQGRTFTTGATASNIVGLACGREYVVNKAIRSRGRRNESHGPETVGELGLLAACQAAGITNIQVLTTLPHSSLKKASSIVGLGRDCFHRVSKREDGLEFDLDLLEHHMKRPQTASIVVISCAEVNTGRFATHGVDDVNALRSLCDQYGAWLHVDAAFGLFARVLEPSEEFNLVRRGAEGLELADSIAGDAHKLLNVPYDCGFFFSRHADLAQQVFQNPNASYLQSGDSGPNQIQSPLNIGLENSRRFRALPVYGTLISYGRLGYRHMLQRQIRFARLVAQYLFEHPDFDLLPEDLDDKATIVERIYIIVLFRGRDDALNSTLVKLLNSTSQLYVSGTTWQGRPACRIAVANWQVHPERELAMIQATFVQALEIWDRMRSEP